MNMLVYLKKMISVFVTQYTLQLFSFFSSSTYVAKQKYFCD